MTVTWLIWGLKNLNNRSSQSLHLSCLEQGMGTDAPGLAISRQSLPVLGFRQVISAGKFQSNPPQ